jgi:dephospho-CoA kinase
MKLVGLTGGICCGKSTVVQMIRELSGDGGFQGGRRPPVRVGVVDCDLIARQVVEPGNWGYRRVVRAFGDGVLAADKTIDRAKLGSLIFGNPEARKSLNRATHLPILARMFAMMIRLWLRDRCDVVVVDMPLLYEIGFQRFTSPNTVVVACSRDTQIERLQRRDGLSMEAAKQRVEAQMPIETKVEMADYVLENDGVDRERLKEDVRETFAAIVWDRRPGMWLAVPAVVLCVVAFMLFLGWSLLRIIFGR